MDIVKALESHGLKISYRTTYNIDDRCRGCLFKEYYRDMGASTPICGREDDLEKAFKANNKSGLCPWYITKTQVRELQDCLLKGE